MKAILFDLDGTLLPMDIDQFMKLYFHEMGNTFEGLLDRESLIHKVMNATGIMIHDTSERTNEEVFMTTFEATIEGDLSDHQEHNHYCKPNLQLYEEVLEAIGMSPEECLMVGNDVQEDLIVGELGISTYLIEDHMIHRTNKPIKTTYGGNYQAFLRFVEEVL
jgi:FMN phosphatase YigB (HAD superfamily)